VNTPEAQFAAEVDAKIAAMRRLGYHPNRFAPKVLFTRLELQEAERRVGPPERAAR
jgi:hypothetical protein